MSTVTVHCYFSDTFHLVEVFTDKTIDLENNSYKGGFVVLSAILKPAV